MQLHRGPEMGFGVGVLFAMIRQLRHLKVILRGPFVLDASCQRFGLIEASAHDAGRVEIVVEQVVHRLAIMWIQRDGGFKTLARFDGV